MYSGYGSTNALYASNVKVIEYKGHPHLTFWQGDGSDNGERGAGVIMDNSYHVIQTVSSGFGRLANMGMSLQCFQAELHLPQ